MFFFAFKKVDFAFFASSLH